MYPAQLQLLCLQGQMSGTSHPQLPTRLPCCYSRDTGPPGQQLSLKKDFTEHEFHEGGSLHKGKDGLCSIIQCRFWVCRVEHLKLKGPGPCATCRAVTSLHRVHTKQESPGIKSNHAACIPPIKENENMRCALVGGVAPEPGASTITDSHLERRARASSGPLRYHWKQDAPRGLQSWSNSFPGNADAPRSGPTQVATASQRREMPPPRLP